MGERFVVDNLVDARRQANQSAGFKNMAFGALWCIGGTIVTVMGYAAASSGTGGGRYMVFWGAIVFGAIQFFRGLGQAVSR